MLEANFITSFVAKVCWVFVYIAVYGLRPVIIKPKPVGELPLLNAGLQFLMNLCLSVCHEQAGLEMALTVLG